jgi:hypothetical protein
MLFNKYSILDVLPAKKQKLKEKIQSFKADYLLNASEQDFVASLVEEFTLNVPTIDESKIEMDYREKQIDVSGDPNRVFFDSIHSWPQLQTSGRSLDQSVVSGRELDQERAHIPRYYEPVSDARSGARLLLARCDFRARSRTT